MDVAAPSRSEPHGSLKGPSPATASMESSQENLFDEAMARYQAGAAAEILPTFLSITEAAPRQSAGWTCLSWLQLLCDQPEEALRSARFAVKLRTGPTSAHQSQPGSARNPIKRRARSNPGGAESDGFCAGDDQGSSNINRGWPESQAGLESTPKSQSLARSLKPKPPSQGSKTSPSKRARTGLDQRSSNRLIQAEKHHF